MNDDLGENDFVISAQAHPGPIPMTAAEKKILIVIMDGLGDRACRDLRGLTPLQYIRHPNLDWFISHGQGGLCYPIAPGVRPGSDTAHLAILGYDVPSVYTGRGPFEAIGIGMDIQPGDVALRCNFATVDDELEILDRRAGRIREPETTELVESLDGIEIDGVECLVKESTEHRAVLLLRGDDLSPEITDADPGGDTHLLMVEPKTEEAEFTASVVTTPPTGRGWPPGSLQPTYWSPGGPGASRTSSPSPRGTTSAPPASPAWG